MANGKFDSQNQQQIVETTLDLLNAVNEDPSVSQRGLSSRLGVALGLTNAVIKRCMKKGLLKVRQAPAHRFVYYLTPQGFAEKSRLTAEYLSHSLRFYKEARQEFTEMFRYCATRGWTRVVLVGATEFAEIASLAAPLEEVEIVGILDPGRNEAAFCGFDVFQSLEDIEPSRRPHAVMITETSNPQEAYEELLQALPAERVLAPKLMRISIRAPEPEPQNSSGGNAP